MVRAFLQIFPEGHIGVMAEFRQILSRHLERIGLELHTFLPRIEGFTHDCINLFDLSIGHRKAPARRTGAMHHNVTTRTAHRTFHRIGVADIEGEPIGRIRVQLACCDAVKAFRHLPVTFLALWAQLARPATDRIGFQQDIIALAIALPDLNFRFLFIGPDEDRRAPIGVFLRHQR